MAKNALKSKTAQPKQYGLATVKVGKNSAKITFEESGESYKFSLDDIPSRPKLLPESEDTYMVVLTPDKDGVEKIGPAEGHFQAHCVDMARPEEDADPVPVEVEREFKGKTVIQVKFTPIFEILTGKYKGLQIPHFLQYKFAEDEDGNAMWDGDPTNPKAVHLPRLVEFCEKTGCVESPIEWPEDGNILPELLSRIQKKDRTVDLVIKKGYIDSILASDYEDADEDVEEVDEDEDVEEVKPKGKKSFKPTDAPKQKSYKTTAQVTDEGKKKSKKVVDEDEDL